MHTELRLRARTVIAAASGLIFLTAIVGSLFPSLGGSIGKLNLSKEVSGLIGGRDFSTITGWLRTEITSIYGPLVFSGVAILAATTTIAGEEEQRILSSYLPNRSRARGWCLRRRAGSPWSSSPSRSPSSPGCCSRSSSLVAVSQPVT